MSWVTSVWLMVILRLPPSKTQFSLSLVCVCALSVITNNKFKHIGLKVLTNTVLSFYKIMSSPTTPHGLELLPHEVLEFVITDKDKTRVKEKTYI